MTSIPTEGLRTPPPYGTVPPERWTHGGAQWGAIAGGAFSGLATTLLMATLGAAIGLTVGAGSDVANASGESAREAAIGAGIGAGIWLLISAAVTGLVGGAVLGRMARTDRTYRPALLGLVTWASGLTLAALLTASGAGSMAGGVSGGLAGAAGAVAPQVARTDRFDARPMEASARRSDPTEAERAELAAAAEQAAAAGATAAWFMLVAQLIGLGTTILVASRIRPAVEIARTVP